MCGDDDRYRASCPRTSVDILGTNCDQCRSTVQCCFTATETVKGSLGTGALDVHLDFHLSYAVVGARETTLSPFLTGRMFVRRTYFGHFHEL